MLKRTLIFLLINFAGLALGSLWTNTGVTSDWYQGLAKAPWTPPGWVFGAAWTTIMICFSIFIAKAWEVEDHLPKLKQLFVASWILNVAWNPVFFLLREVEIGLALISSLTIVIAVIFFKYLKLIRNYALLMLPYLIWLCIATSLNLYILLYN